jgi:hypothetical protein
LRYMPPVRGAETRIGGPPAGMKEIADATPPRDWVRVSRN